jgi:hypothetical protein
MRAVVRPAVVEVAKLGVLTGAKSPVIAGGTILAGLKTRSPDLKSGAGTELDTDWLRTGRDKNADCKA